MKVNGKRFSSIIVLAVLVASLCLAGTAVAAEKVTLIYWDTTGPEATAIARANNFAEYTKANPNVQIKEEIFGGSLSEFDTKFKMAMVAGKGPDLIETHDVAFYAYYTAGFLQNVPKVYEDYIREQAINEATVQMVEADGKLYGFPNTWHGVVVVYNKTMLAEAGLSLPPFDWDWDIMLDYAKKLTKYDTAGEVSRAGLSLRKTGHAQGTLAKFSPFFFAAGVPKSLSYWTEDLKKTVINTTPGRVALQFYVDAIYKHKVDSLQVKSDYMGFAQGTVAMFHRGLWVTAYMQEYAPDIDFGIIEVPKLEFPQLASSIVSGGVYGVTKGCENPEEAWDVLYGIAQPEPHAYYAKESVFLPSFKNAAQQDFFVQNPMWQIAIQQKARPEAQISTLYELEMVIGGYIEKACYQQLSVEEALRLAEEKCNEILAEAR